MNSEPENFESLRRLLALKRHEQPPPGYFNNFSRQVMARLQAGASVADPEIAAGSWWQRLRLSLETNSIFAGAFGAAVCAVLISGILNSEQTGPAPAISGSLAGQTASPLGDSPLGDSPLSLIASKSAEMPMSAGSNSITSLFDQFQPSVQPVSVVFGIPGGN